MAAALQRNGMEPFRPQITTLPAFLVDELDSEMKQDPHLEQSGGYIHATKIAKVKFGAASISSFKI